MRTHPFTLLHPYHDVLWVGFCDKEDAIGNDAALQKLLKADATVELDQVHGNMTIVACEPEHRTHKADGVITDTPDLTLTLRIADCQAFLAYAPKQNAVGLLHAGWKGLLNGAIPAFIKTFSETFDVDPSELIVCIAPSLCVKCSEFTDPAKELSGIDPQFFHGRNADLRGIADAQLRDAGVTQIERMPECTKCDADRLWSYRAERESILNGSRNVLCVALRGSQL